MTDKEMLELAAKAAGVDGEYVENSPLNGAYRTGIYDRFLDHEWNPLTDDGDALRLAVKLEMVVDTIELILIGSPPSVCVGIDFDEQYTCPESAVRRAIVRAAAEVGKNMK